MRLSFPSGIRRKTSVLMPSSASKYAAATNGLRNMASNQLIATF